MNQEKFINSYVELLTATVTESIQKNLVLQTQKKIAEQDLNEVTIKINELEGKFKQELTNKQNEVDSLKHQLFEMRKQKDASVAESGELKKSMEHIDTFKNELVKARKHNENLVTKSEELQLEIESKSKMIENLTTELAKHLKPQVEAKSNKKNPFKIVDTVEDAGNF
jgi:chromosome segregation ATPase